MRLDNTRFSVTRPVFAEEAPATQVESKSTNHRDNETPPIQGKENMSECRTQQLQQIVVRRYTILALKATQIFHQINSSHTNLGCLLVEWGQCFFFPNKTMEDFMSVEVSDFKCLI
jgi:hypothetical protein